MAKRRTPAPLTQTGSIAYGSIADAISFAYGAFQSVRDEVAEVVDAAEGGRAETQRIVTLGETRDELDAFADDEPDVPKAIELLDLKVTWYVTRPKRGFVSRRNQINDGVAALNAVIEALTPPIPTGKPPASWPADAIDELTETLQEAIDGCDNLEFPGIYG